MHRCVGSSFISFLRMRTAPHNGVPGVRRPRDMACTAAADATAVATSWAGTCHTAAAALCSVRHYSEGRTSFSGEKASAWPQPGKAPSYPYAKSEFPLPRPQFRKTHIEWMLHHGHGDRYGKYGPTREVADFEYADGTPSPISRRRFALKHHQDHLLVQLIRAGAAVEQYEESGMLPRVPGTREQRDWDVQIPLFLDDLDERGLPAATTTSRHGPTEGAKSTLSSGKAHIHASTVARTVDEYFKTSSTSRKLTSPGHEPATELTPNTMFATYDPEAFVSDRVEADKRRPHWSRRRWALTDNFMVHVSPKPKNTIKDE